MHWHLAQLTVDPKRLGVNIESAHAILAGLDPSDEMGFALAFDKLWTVHLNDQNGLKFDQDKSFGSVDLRRAFNQVRILDKYDYGKNGEFVSLDVKAMRTQKDKRRDQTPFQQQDDIPAATGSQQKSRQVADRCYDKS